MPTWTTEQKRILDASGNILVSASAGSGKTTVVVQKILDIVTKSDADVDEVLVMTYTNASAADMRAKIINKLYDTVKDTDISEEMRLRVKEQLDNLSFSDIGTADAFCGKLIRENFERLGISPTVAQMDEDEASNMKRRVISRLIAEEYENRNSDFLSVVNKITKIVDDTPIADVVLKLYAASRINPNPAEFKKMLLQSADFNPDGFYGREILRYYADAAADMMPFADTIASELWHLESTDYYASLLEAIKIIRTVATAESPVELRKALSLMSVSTVRASKKNTISPEDKIKINAVRDAAKGLVSDIDKKLFVEYDGYNVSEARDYVKVVMRLVDAFDAAYTAEKVAACKLDFNDLSQYALTLLSDDDIAYNIAGKYRFVFIDEYQDINPLQEEIIKKLSRNNVFMVGDGKQGIYAFRNAEPEIMNEKRRLYSGGGGGQALDMTVNFRSTKEILGFCDDVFSAVMDDGHGGVDYAATSKFLSDNVNEAPIKGAEVEVNLFTVGDEEEYSVACTGVYSVEHHVESAEKEEVFGYREGAEIAERIKDLIGKPYVKNDKDKTIAHYEYADIAVLFKNRSGGAEGFLRALADNGIPYVSDGFVSDAGRPYIKQLICLLKALDNFSDDIAATGFLLSWFGGFTENEVYLIRAAAPKMSIEEGLKKMATGGSLCEKCRTAVSTVEKWRSRAAYVSVDVLLDEVITETGFDTYVLSRPSGSTELHAVDVFIKGKGAGGSVQSFLDYYNNSNKKDVVLPPSDFGNAVRISTVHGSKGLEYPAVFLARIDVRGKRPDYSDVIFDKDLGIGLKCYNESTREKKNSPAYTAIELARKRRENSENIRLFYVALTRAMRFLSLSGAADKNIQAKLDFPVPRVKISTFYDLLLYAAAKNGSISRKVKEVKELSPDRLLIDEKPFAVFNRAELVYTEEIGKVVNYVYKYGDATTVSPKYTVSDLNRNFDDTVYVRSVTGGEDNRAKGIAYHTVMEHIDFSFSTLSEVNEFILSLTAKGYLTEEDAALVDGTQILACINNPIVKDGIKGKYLREKPFMLRLPASFIADCPDDDKVLIQGTADLILFGKETAVIDFKYSGLPDEKLAEKYKKQLNLYETAVETAFKVKVDKKLLYSFKSGRFIEIN